MDTMRRSRQNNPQRPQRTAVSEFLLIEELQKKSRHLQQVWERALPVYTSPPTDIAMEATPENYRSDEVINAFRNLSFEGGCSPDGDTSTYCHIPFEPPSAIFESSKIGVIIYAGAFVDPRGYSPLAKIIAERYGIPSVIPVFDGDIPLRPGVCGSGRLPMAQAQFGRVEKWVLVGHSFGGVAAMSDAWQAMTDANSTIGFDSIGGLTMLASDILDIGCGNTSFASTDFPMAMSTATEDEILNRTRYNENLSRVSNSTFFVEIFGGNHGQYGSYDYSGRVEALGPTQKDGIPLIPAAVQWDVSTAAVFHVASRSGAALPERIAVTESPSSLPTVTVSPSDSSSTAAESPSASPVDVTIPPTESPVSQTTTKPHSSSIPTDFPSIPTPTPSMLNSMPSMSTSMPTSTLPPSIIGSDPPSSDSRIGPSHSISAWILPLLLFLSYWR